MTASVPVPWMTWLGVKYRDSAAARPMDASAEELLFTEVVPDADPSSEAVFVAGYVLAAAETVRHHRPAEVAVLLGATLPHVLLGSTGESK